jgi:hypothetical protein
MELTSINEFCLIQGIHRPVLERKLRQMNVYPKGSRPTRVKPCYLWDVDELVVAMKSIRPSKGRPRKDNS